MITSKYRGCCKTGVLWFPNNASIIFQNNRIASDNKLYAINDDVLYCKPLNEQTGQIPCGHKSYGTAKNKVGEKYYWLKNVGHSTFCTGIFDGLQGKYGPVNKSSFYVALGKRCHNLFVNLDWLQLIFFILQSNLCPFLRELG